MRRPLHSICALCLGTLNLLAGADSLRFPSLKKGPNSSSIGMGSDETDLPSLLHAQNNQQSEVFSDAIKILDSMKSSPSCNRLAAANLILSCQSLGGDDGTQKAGLSDSLDNVKSLFAARLAVCELIGAGAAIPEQCPPILITHPTYRHPDAEDPVQPSHLAPCLNSLESRPQWWTSYSNNRQNAAVMCQAARTEIEREDDLKRYKNLMDITSILNDSLNQTLTSAAMETSRQRAFLKIVDDMRNTLLQDLEDGFLRYHDITTKVFDDVEGVQIVMAAARSEAANVKEDLHSASNSMHELKQVLNEIHLSTTKRAAEMAAAEQENHQANLALVSSVRQSAEHLRNQDLEPIIESFGKIYYSMHAVEDFMRSMEARHDGLDSRMKLFEQAFQQFETTAVALQQVQLQHRHDQKSFQTDLRITQAILKDVTASTANLQTSIENSYAVFRKLTTFGGAVTSVAWWTLSTAVVFLILLYPKFTGAALIFLASAFATYCMGVSSWLQTVRASSTYTTQQLTNAIYIVSFSLGIASVLCTFLYLAAHHILPRIRRHTVQTTNGDCVTTLDPA
ncbi:nuclear membrane fusion protein Kar5 [Blastomyces dermatitidis ER-3]|uniref:Nuclear membrane fusion protein Kar5 n=1 Tax=Ajellomyces dermatitidis (strain ER-3 / ATCC MYA-2586) TaxID=559297 RepID=A0ABP2EZT3_AJEDR|nr:nuclear membrane fusion protein Kar5 [Blastomyces dermatitidis ER-3]EEQ88403.2 nuclear membrane fusion protein Kar5 [Blastomyces dermatitidis ER-3]